MPTVEDLGKRVKAKYPGTYDDLSDVDLGKRVKTKYPGSYDDFSDIPEQAPSLTQRVGTGISDFFEGVTSGVASTGFQTEDIIRRLTGQERRIDQPEVQQLMTAPESFAGQAGRFVEGAAEFAIPLSRLAKATAGMSTLRRVAAEAAGGGAVAGVQSGGDPASIALGAAGGAAVPGVGRLVRNVAQGAREGGVGGALATAVRGVTKIDPVDAMFRALKPRSTRLNFRQALKEAIPEIKASEAAIGKPIEGVEDLLAATRAAKQRIWAAREQILGPAREMGSQVDMSPVADAIQASIPARTKLMDPVRAGNIFSGSDSYRKKVTLQEAEELMKNVNDELEAFYNQYPIAQRAAQTSNPAIAPVVAEAKALRSAIDKTLREGGPDARAFSRKYGQLMEIEGEMHRRWNVAARQQPESLAEQLAGASAAGDIARGAWSLGRGDLLGAADVVAGQAKRQMAKFLKTEQLPDTLVRRAMAAVKELPAPYPQPVKPRIAGLLEAGPVRMGAGPDPSSVRAARAGITVVRDPKTGRMKRAYTSRER